MLAIERATAHFEAIGRQSLEIPEWGSEKDGPFVVTWTPLTLYQHRKIYRPGRESGADLMIDLIIMKAEDANGQKLFTEKDRHTLLTAVDRGVLSRIAAAIARGPSVEDLEKN